MTNRITIGIDPDVERSGMAIVETTGTQKRLVGVMNLDFPHLIEECVARHGAATYAGTPFRVMVEAGYLNGSNWHLGRGMTARAAAKIGNNTGRNHETARKIVEMLRYYGIAVEEVRPLAKVAGGVHLWNSRDGKITAEELKRLTGYDKTTNQDGRDAALIAWTFG